MTTREKALEVVRFFGVEPKTFVFQVAQAYLAEHPADDDEPVTEEWLLSIGFIRRGPHLESPGSMLMMWSEGACSIIAGSHFRTVPHPKTRRQVRRLLDALGIERKEAQ